MKTRLRLSSKKIEGLVAEAKEATKPRRHHDGDGLYLETKPGRHGVTANWQLRFYRDGKSAWTGLGPLRRGLSPRGLSLAEARIAAHDALLALRNGSDPVAQRKAEREAREVAAASSVTFEAAAQRYLATFAPGWRNPKHRAQWGSTLANYAYPVFGALPVAAIDTGLVCKVLEPIWTAKPETASRVRGRIEKILDWAKTRGYRDGENPARWKGHLENLLLKRSKVAKVEHHPALPYADLPAFMAGLRARNSLSARALEFTILTAARSGATIGATWDEIDFDNKIWTVPPSRAGVKITGDDAKPRVVPLSPRVLELLQGLPREAGNKHVFIGGKAGAGFSNMAMAELLQAIAPASTSPGKIATVHGMRSTFKDWCAECTHYPNEVSEAALWHVVADKVEAAYRRGQLLAKRRQLMDAWAKYCGSRPIELAENHKVVPISRRQS